LQVGPVRPGKNSSGKILDRRSPSSPQPADPTVEGGAERSTVERARRDADLELVRAALAARAAARSALVERLGCVPAMVRVIARRRGVILSPVELEDLEQETLLEVWGKLPRYDGRASLETWVWGFCFNQIRRAASRRPIVPRPAAEADLERVAQPEREGHLELDDVDLVKDAVDSLGPPADEVVRLRYREELPFEEIGARLRLPANTAKTHYYRALARLRQRLAPIDPSDAR
jgi:RNA polymerase sigma-70 factor (ECF subfamily)